MVYVRSVALFLIALSLTNADTIITNIDQQYTNKNITCAPNAPCSVICQHFESCLDSTISCPISNTCDITCNHSRSCAHAMIYAQDSSHFRLLDCAYGAFTCIGITIYFPSNDQGTPISELIGADTGLSAGSSDGFPLQFYAIHGWKDVSIDTSDYFVFSTAHRGLMHCTDDYSVTCDFAADAWACDDTNDICNDPPPPTTAVPSTTPTSEPTVNPSSSPTVEPSLNPSEAPTVEPTSTPSTEPTSEPTSIPSVPSTNPTLNPTNNPSISHAPTIATINPSKHPTLNPTINPSISPTLPPTFNPSIHPSLPPTFNPTTNPTISPTKHPVLTVTTTDSVIPKPTKAHDVHSGKTSNVLDTYRKYMLYVIIAMCGICIILSICCLCKLKKRSKVAAPAPMTPHTLGPINTNTINTKPVDYNTHQQYYIDDESEMHDDEEKAIFVDDNPRPKPKSKSKHKQKIPSVDDDDIFEDNPAHFQKTFTGTGTPYMSNAAHITPMGVQSYEYTKQTEANLDYQGNTMHNQNQFPPNNAPYDRYQDNQQSYVPNSNQAHYGGYQGSVDVNGNQRFGGYHPANTDINGNSREINQRYDANRGNGNQNQNQEHEQEQRQFLSSAQANVAHGAKPTPR